MNLYFRFYCIRAFKKMNEKKINRMFDYIAKTEETKHFGDFLRQVATAYGNKYLYTQDESIKGSAYALVTLAEKFDERTPKAKMKEKARQKKMVGNKNRKVKY